MKSAAAFLLFGIALWWLWQLLTGEWSRYEWIAGAGGAAVAAAIALLAVARTEGAVAFPLAVLKGVPSALGMVFVDFVTILRVLVVRRPGVMRETAFPHPDTEAFRTWAVIAGDWSPNAYIVDVSNGRVLSHHLVPRDQSQRPA